MSSAKKAAAFFEQAASDSAKVQTNAKQKKIKTWTPHNNNNDGAHNSTGFKLQIKSVESGGPPPKRSLADLP
eukprot:TRINITY_DN75790_c2_g1_i1.p1 TRINITY_DN75790_c2_g1~~TRINITY_DN75790_c2_g1_i1.p1  ORF type:complete len:82 (-),score=20.93 TRINITY_DN75790_c2_g1_i1:105-320(-)